MATQSELDTIRECKIKGLHWNPMKDDLYLVDGVETTLNSSADISQPYDQYDYLPSEDDARNYLYTANYRNIGCINHTVTAVNILTGDTISEIGSTDREAWYKALLHVINTLPNLI